MIDFGLILFIIVLSVFIQSSVMIVKNSLYFLSGTFKIFAFIIVAITITGFIQETERYLVYT